MADNEGAPKGTNPEHTSSADVPKTKPDTEGFLGHAIASNDPNRPLKIVIPQSRTIGPPPPDRPSPAAQEEAAHDEDTPKESDSNADDKGAEIPDTRPQSNLDRPGDLPVDYAEQDTMPHFLPAADEGRSDTADPDNDGEDEGSSSSDSHQTAGHDALYGPIDSTVDAATPSLFDQLSEEKGFTPDTPEPEPSPIIDNGEEPVVPGRHARQRGRGHLSLAEEPVSPSVAEPHAIGAQTVTDSSEGTSRKNLGERLFGWLPKRKERSEPQQNNEAANAEPQEHADSPKKSRRAKLRENLHYLRTGQVLSAEPKLDDSDLIPADSIAADVIKQHGADSPEAQSAREQVFRKAHREWENDKPSLRYRIATLAATHINLEKTGKRSLVVASLAAAAGLTSVVLKARGIDLSGGGSGNPNAVPDAIANAVNPGDIHIDPSNHAQPVHIDNAQALANLPADVQKEIIDKSGDALQQDMPNLSAQQADQLAHDSLSAQTHTDLAMPGADGQTPVDGIPHPDQAIMSGLLANVDHQVIAGDSNWKVIQETVDQGPNAWPTTDSTTKGNVMADVLTRFAKQNHVSLPAVHPGQTLTAESYQPLMDSLTDDQKGVISEITQAHNLDEYIHSHALGNLTRLQQGIPLDHAPQTTALPDVQAPAPVHYDEPTVQAFLHQEVPATGDTKVETVVEKLFASSELKAGDWGGENGISKHDVVSDILRQVLNANGKDPNNLAALLQNGKLSLAELDLPSDQKEELLKLLGDVMNTDKGQDYWTHVRPLWHAFQNKYLFANK